MIAKISEMAQVHQGMTSSISLIVKERFCILIIFFTGYNIFIPVSRMEEDQC